MVRFFRVPFFFFVLVSFHYTEYRNLTTDRPDMGQPREPKQCARRAWYRVTRVRVTCDGPCRVYSLPVYLRVY